MAENFENWQKEAPRWISALADALTKHGEDDVVVPYGQVALAFPSSEPNPLSFDSPLIDHGQLRQWALTLGWKIRPAPEMAAKGSNGHPPVRFSKQA